MTFRELIDCGIEDGKHFRRRRWPDGHYMFFDGNKLKGRFRDGVTLDISKIGLNAGELLADDWEVRA